MACRPRNVLKKISRQSSRRESARKEDVRIAAAQSRRRRVLVVSTRPAVGGGEIAQMNRRRPTATDGRTDGVEIRRRISCTVMRCHFGDRLNAGRRRTARLNTSVRVSRMAAPARRRLGMDWLAIGGPGAPTIRSRSTLSRRRRRAARRSPGSTARPRRLARR